MLQGSGHPTAVEVHHELRFSSMARTRHDFAFPCDAQGHVFLDDLSERARANYFYARTLVGIDWLEPVVLRVDESVTGANCA